jgi:ABC-type glycerol-3-phosphate transport system substrate-binding protein
MWRSKIILFWLLAAVLITSLAACGGGDQTLEETSQSSVNIITATPRNTAIPTVTPTPQVPELEVDALQGLELNFWYIWDPTLPDTLQVMVRRFNAENQYGIQVTARQFPHPADFATAMQEAVATRQPPHVALANPYEYNAWREVEALVNMAPYLESPVYGLEVEELEQVYPVFLARDLDQTERYGFPGLLPSRYVPPMSPMVTAQEAG